MSLHSRLERIEREQAGTAPEAVRSIEVWEQIRADAWRLRSTGEVLDLASVEARPGVSGRISRIPIELSPEFWEPAGTA